jgi:hypothetical protein
VLAKVTVPFQSGWLLFAKAGPAYVWSRTPFKKSLQMYAPITYHDANDTFSTFRPEAAIGVGYQLDEYWSIHGQFAYVWGTGNHPFSGNFIPGMQQWMGGVQYNFA